MPGVWKLQARDPATQARSGWLRSMDGRRLPTPLFQPVATAASLKTLDWQDLRRIGYRHVLMNTYHLVVRPGLESIAGFGGIKPFSGWAGSVLTDSGGYQVYSLAARRSIRPDGVRFSDHIGGQRWHFSPEFVLRAQLCFGVDFAMPLDICTGLPATRERTAKDMALTHSWAREQAQLWPELLARQQAAARKGERGRKAAHASSRVHPPALFGIVQGGLEEDLRRESAQFVAAQGFDALAVGGLAVGEPREDFLRLTAFCGPLLPADKVRYLMGVGNPADLLHAIAAGFDMFDCVQPTRMARHGVLYTRQGLLRMNNARFRDDARPVDPRCACPTCAGHSRAYLRHLLKLQEHSYARFATLHNLQFYYDLMRQARRKIRKGRFGAWYPAAALRLAADLPADL
ncbi:tRNA guanosine(34) transglycosylase Tgt [bacterium]|nr:tRNA guanosine(34) transglycosylase Tgt [bacterium]